MDEYDGRKNDHLYVTPYRLQVEEDGKVYRFQKNGALQEDYMMIEDGQCVNYNNEGEKVCSYEAHFFDTHLPTRLKKVGFFDEYPTPSSFLSSFKDEKKITEATSSDHIEDADGPNMVETDAFVLNIKSHKFHKPSCVTLNDMNQNDLQTVEWEREQVIGAGYEPCRRCNP